jgi:hypothetical protein
MKVNGRNLCKFVYKSNVKWINVYMVAVHRRKCSKLTFVFIICLNCK